MNIAEQLKTQNFHDFSDTTERHAIDAIVLREAILLADIRHTASAVCPTKFTLRHARITGDLDLSNLYPAQEKALISLEFEDCLFENDIILRNSTLSQLSFSYSKLRKIDGNNIYCCGSIEFEAVESSEHPDNLTGMSYRTGWQGKRGPLWIDDTGEENISEENVACKHGASVPQGLCWLQFNQSTIKQNFDIKSSLLVSPAPRTDIDLSNTILRTAVELSGSEIGGSVRILERSALLGGIKIGGSVIEKDLFAAGAKLIAGESKALSGQHVHVKGFVGLRNKMAQDGSSERFEAIGKIDFMSAVIDSMLDLTGGHFMAGEDGIAFSLAYSSLGSIRMNLDNSKKNLPTEIFGQVQATHFKVNEIGIYYTIIQPAKFKGMLKENAPQIDYLLDLQNSEVQNQVVLAGTLFRGINLTDAKIGTSLCLGYGDQLPLRFTCPPQEIRIVNLEGARVGTSLRISKLQVDTPTGIDILREALSRKEEIHCRIMPLSFAPDVTCYEFMVKRENRMHYATVLRNKNKYSILDGVGPAIYNALDKSIIYLDTDARLADYIRFFTQNIFANNGPFILVEPDSWLQSILPQDCQNLVQPFQLHPTEKIVEKNPEAYLATATVTIWHGTAIFIATIAVKRNDYSVEMLDDELIFEGLPQLIEFNKPLKFLHDDGQTFSESWEMPPYLSTEATFRQLSIFEKRRMRMAAKKMIYGYRTRPVVCLRNADINELNDNDGNSWPETLRLELAGLRYNALQITDRGHEVRSRKRKSLNKKLENTKKRHQHPVAYRVGGAIGLGAILAMGYFLLKGMWYTFNTNMGWPILAAAIVFFIIQRWYCSHTLKPIPFSYPWQARRRWLRLQYEGYWPTKQEFNPQPLEQLAKTFQKQGQEIDFNRISRLKLNWKHATQTLWVLRPATALFREGFGYGYSVHRSIVTFLLLLLIGIAGAFSAQKHNLLINNETPGQLSVVQECSKLKKLPVSCGNNINPVLYAIDVFLPVIDLGQEKKCIIRPDCKAEIQDFDLDGKWEWTTDKVKEVVVSAWRWAIRLQDRPVFWEFAKSFYKLLGWLVTSLMILTISGTLRRTKGE